MMKFLLVFSVLGTLASVPGGQAHTCQSHDPTECNAGQCVEGENHEHTDFNEDQEDSYCKSERDPYECKFFGRYWPEETCKLLKDGVPPE